MNGSDISGDQTNENALSDALSNYRRLTSRFDGGAKDPASRKVGIELPLSDVLNLLPAKYVVQNRPGTVGKTVFLPIPNLVEQLRKGKVALSIQELAACVPAAMLDAKSFEDSSIVVLPLAKVVNAMDPALLDQGDTTSEKEYDLANLPDPFRKAESGLPEEIAPTPEPTTSGIPPVSKTPPIHDAPPVPEAPVVPPPLPKIAELEPEIVSMPPPVKPVEHEIAAPPIPEPPPVEPPPPVAEPPLPTIAEVEPEIVSPPPLKPVEQEIAAPPIPEPPPVELPPVAEPPPLPTIEEIEAKPVEKIVPPPIAEPVVAPPLPPPPAPEEKPFKPAEVAAEAEQVEEIEEPEIEALAPPAGVNINGATAEQLVAVEGLSLAVAKKIVEYRQTNGHFKSIFSLCNVPGMTKKLFKAVTGMPYSSKKHHRGRKLVRLLNIPRSKICHMPSIAEAVGKIPGISGCVISDKEGLVITASQAGPLAEAIGAVSHEVTSHMRKSMEMTGARNVDSVSISIKRQMFTIICSGEIYITVVHDSYRITGAKLAQIRSVAEELEWVLSRRLYVGT